MKTINDLGKIVTGKTPQTSHSDYFGSDIPFITPSDMKGKRTIVQTERYLSHKGIHTVKNCIIPANSVCISCIGSDMGKVVLTTSESVTNQQINSIIVDEVNDPRFVYYLMCTLYGQIKSLGKNATAVPILNKTKFSNIAIDIPLLETQNRIANILSAYDDLIENNQKQIKLLEETAMRLYKEWFVNLRFPGYETAKIIDGVPEGWYKKSINDLMTFHRGYDLTKNNMQGGLVPVVGSTSVIGYHNEFKIKGPGIVTGRSGSLGTYQLIWEDFWPHNTSLYICDYKWHDVFFVYCLLQTVDFSSLNSGGAIPTLNRNTLSNIIVLEPNQDLQNRFTEIAKILYERVHTSTIQIIKLIEARDKLLPKLMSGEIEINPARGATA